MKEIFNKLEKMFSAAAFAEEGEFETAKLIMKESTPAEIKSRKQAATTGSILQPVKAS